MFGRDTLIRLAALAGIAAAMFGAGYYTGDHQRDNAWRVANAETARLAQRAYVAEVGRGQQAATALQAELIAKEARDAELDQLRQRVAALGPLTVRRPSPRPAAVAPAAVAAEASATAPGCVALLAPLLDGLASAAGDDAEPRLNLRSVWLWNSALTGSGSTPAGACGVDAPTGQATAACAEDSGLDLTDAWANQAANARACADDRLRHQRLIDYLQARDQREAD